jgi:hypothetical protein
VNIIRGKREDAEAERPDGGGGGTVGRRNVLGGLAALPVLVSVGSAAPARAASAVRPGSSPTWCEEQSGGTTPPCSRREPGWCCRRASRPCPSWITTIVRASRRFGGVGLAVQQGCRWHHGRRGTEDGRKAMSIALTEPMFDRACPLVAGQGRPVRQLAAE